jgi:hypothetical protein
MAFWVRKNFRVVYDTRSYLVLVGWSVEWAIKEASAVVADKSGSG